MRRRRLVSGLAAAAAASLASGQTPARPYRAATISRERPDRIVIYPLPRRGVLIAAGTAMPLHHPPSTVGRARAAQRCWAGGIEAQETVARRRHAPGHEPAGVHAAVVCASAARPSGTRQRLLLPISTVGCPAWVASRPTRTVADGQPRPRNLPDRKLPMVNGSSRTAAIGVATLAATEGRPATAG
jgi:hypothetical protein